MDIKEIAQKLAPGYWKRDQWNIEYFDSVGFAEALIAELAKQNEPVAEVLSLFPGEPDSYINARAIGVDPFNTWTFPQPGTKLYTSPPTAEQIANETAEAIAKMVEFDTIDPEAIRSGAWKEFKK